MGFDFDLDADAIRTELNEIPAEMIPDGVIESAIADEEVVVAAELPDQSEWGSEEYPDISEDAVALLWKRRAAREAFHASPTEVRRQALDAVVSYDIQAFRGRLNKKVEKAYDILGLARGGSSAAFGTATRHLEGDRPW